MRIVRGMPLDGVLAANHHDTQHNSSGESSLVLKWSQEQTLRLPLDLHSQAKRSYDHNHHTFSFLATFFLLWITHEFCG